MLPQPVPVNFPEICVWQDLYYGCITMLGWFTALSSDVASHVCDLAWLALVLRSDCTYEGAICTCTCNTSTCTCSNTLSPVPRLS